MKEINISNYKQIKSKHDKLCQIVFDILDSQHLNPKLHIEYDNGELDVYCNNVYYECKCNFNKKSYKKGSDQIYRAIDKCREPDVNKGYVVTYKGVYEVK